MLSNTVATKLISIGPFIVSGGIIVFPLTYIFGDVLTEVYGYKQSRKIIWTGFFVLLLMSLVYWLVGILPPAMGWLNQTAYNTILGLVPRIALASLIAYWLGEFSNSFVLAKMKLLTQGRHLWMRTIGSTIVGEGIDSTVFVILAFYGVFPNNLLLPAILSGYILKVVYEIIATPLTYRIVKFLKRAEGVDAYDYTTKFNPFHF